jgi:hypothetical protein
MFKITAATNVCLTSEVSPISDLPAKNQVLNSVLLRHSIRKATQRITHNTTATGEQLHAARIEMFGVEMHADGDPSQRGSI